MYVYLKFDGTVRIVSNVTIDDDCGPVVEGKRLQDSPRSDDSTPASPFSSKSSIDAITWFKTLAIEAVYIDCASRDVRWCPRTVTIRDSPPQSPVEMRKKFTRHIKKANPTQFLPENGRQLFSDHPGVVDFNPVIDELFERAEELCCNWDVWAEDSVRINKEVAQILHCYVLPAVTFQREDIPVLRECLRIITHKHRGTENSIIGKEKNISLTENFLNKKKEALLGNEKLTTQAYLEVCGIEFVNNFYIHITKDIQNKNMKLDIVQLKINDLKKSGTDVEKLTELKGKRDALHDSVQKLIIVREAIRNYLYRPFIPKKKKRWRISKKLTIDKEEQSLMQSFLEVNSKMNDEKDQLKLLCYRKLHTAAVREAIESTIQLLQHEDSPEEMGDFSEFSIHGEVNSPLQINLSESCERIRRHWQSMQQRVDEWIERKSAIFHAHDKGCQLIRDLADGMLSDSRIASLGLEPSEIQEGHVNQAGELQFVGDHFDGVELFTISSMSGDGSHTVLSVDHCHKDGEMREDISCRRAPMVQVIRDHVLQHMQKMAEAIVQQMNFDLTPGSRHLNRAWVCYSSHLWKEVNDAVVRVYTHYHAAEAHTVHRHVSAMALADMMDSRMFETIFKPANLSSSSGSEAFEDLGAECLALPRLPSADTVSAISLDLQRCSVTDLYAKVNRDGAKLNCQMLDIESLRCSVASEGSGSEESSSKTANTVINGAQETTDSVATQDVQFYIDECKDSGKGDTMESSKGEMDMPRPSSRASSDSGASVHSDDLFDGSLESEPQLQRPSSKTSDRTVRSSQTVASVLSLFDSIVGPYHAKIREVLTAPDIMQKLKGVWQSVDFLSRKAGELCNQRGMDQLLPLSIFATASFPEDLFVDYFIELLILQDLKPSFALHSMYDFSLTSAFSTYMYLFEKRFSDCVGSSSNQSAR